MNLPYFSKYWKVWLAFNGWKLSGLFYLHLMQLFCADATLFLKKNLIFLPMKTWKNQTQKLLMIGPNFFFQQWQLAQNQPKSQFLFHKNCSSCNLSIMTLALCLGMWSLSWIYTTAKSKYTKSFSNFWSIWKFMQLFYWKDSNSTSNGGWPNCAWVGQFLLQRKWMFHAKFAKTSLVTTSNQILSYNLK